MEKKTKIITRPCSCRCCMLVIEKTMWEDGDVDYDISLQDSHFDHNYHTLWGRLKRAAKVLFGKPNLYSDVYLWMNRSSASWWTRWTPWRGNALTRKNQHNPSRDNGKPLQGFPLLLVQVPQLTTHPSHAKIVQH